MSEQPEALRLADELNRHSRKLGSPSGDAPHVMRAAAAELRRLHALIEEMGVALEGAVRVADRATDEFNAARNAIAKWKESK